MSSAVTRAYDHLRLGILEGRYAHGQHLREVALAAEIGVSRTPVREALRRLAGDGYVEMRPNHGVFVADWSRGSIHDLAALRAHLAVMAGELAAARATAADVAGLRALTARVAAIIEARRPGWQDRAADTDFEFFDTVFAIADNDWLHQCLRQTTLLPVLQQTHHAFSETDWRRMLVHQEEIASALEAGNPGWASSALRAQFEVAKHAVLTAFDGRGAGRRDTGGEGGDAGRAALQRKTA